MGAQGHFDLAASKEALAQLVAACRKRGIAQAMMDLRALRPGPKPVYTPADLAELVGTFRKVGFTSHQRLAILYGSDPHRRARLFAFLSALHGWDVRAFGDFEEALLWLSAHQQAGARRRRRSPGEKTVPVRFSNREAGAPARSATRGRGRQDKSRAGRKQARALTGPGSMRRTARESHSRRP